MKSTQVKAWPELIDFQPAMAVLREQQNKTKNGRPGVDVDFGSVYTITSSGLTIFLLRLIRLLGEKRIPNVKNEFRPEIQKKLDELGAFKILGKMIGSVQGELPLLSQSDEGFHAAKSRGINYPIYRLGFESGKDRRLPVMEFVEWLYGVISKLNDTYYILGVLGTIEWTDKLVLSRILKLHRISRFRI